MNSLSFTFVYSWGWVHELSMDSLDTHHSLLETSWCSHPLAEPLQQSHWNRPIGNSLGTGLRLRWGCDGSQCPSLVPRPKKTAWDAQFAPAQHFSTLVHKFVSFTNGLQGSLIQQIWLRRRFADCVFLMSNPSTSWYNPVSDVLLYSLFLQALHHQCQK